jgi:hypothetical protein
MPMRTLDDVIVEPARVLTVCGSASDWLPSAQESCLRNVPIRRSSARI